MPIRAGNAGRVKEALLASGVISSRPKTDYAKQAGQELVNNSASENWR